MKIFIGLVNIASLMSDYKAGFEALGHEVFCVTTEDHTIQDNVADMNIPQMVEAKLLKENTTDPKRSMFWFNKFINMAWGKALEADLCFFIWHTFQPDYSDLIQLKKMGKKVVVRFCGSEVRDPQAQNQYADYYKLANTEYGLQPNLDNLERKLRYLRTAERYADLIISASNLSLRPIDYIGGYIFNKQGVVCNTEQRQHPILMHAPSNRATKGTDYFLQAFEILKKAGLKFGVKLIENIPHEQMLKEYARVDIVCGSLFFGGRSTWEALAAGCVHLGTCTKQVAKVFQDGEMIDLRRLGLPQDEKHAIWLAEQRDNYAAITESPNIPITVENLVETLANIVTDFPRRQRLAAEGPAFMERYFSPGKACQHILNVIADPEKLEHRASQLSRPFFNLHYLPPADDPERIALLNKYTQFMKDCEWYKAYVKPCERNGLIF